MADPYNPLGVSGMLRAPQAPAPPTFSAPRQQMTGYEQNLNPYYDTLMDEEQQKRNWQRPVQWIFERLQTGQFVSANIAEELIDAFDRDPNTQADFLGAIWDGLTGKRQGSYEKILRERLQTGKGKVFAGADEEKWLGKLDWAKVLGFIGDVILDPMTYASFGGAAKGAKIAASSFADDSVRIMLRSMADNPESIIAKAVGNVDPKMLEAVIAGTSNRGISKLKGMGNDLGRAIDMTYREAYKTGLQRSQAKLLEMTRTAAQGLGDAPDVARIMENVGQGVAYNKAGTRFGGRFLGKEFAVGERRGALTAIKDTEGWEKFARWFSQVTPDTSNLRGAVWGIMNRGSIGEMRRAIGFRNPYQKYLRAQELEQGLELSRVASTTYLKEGLEPLLKHSDEELDLLRTTIARKEGAQFAAATATERQFGAAVVPVDESIVETMDTFGSTMQRWNAEEAFWATRLGEDAAKYREWYLPEMFRDTAGGGNVRKARKYTFEQSAAREADLMQAVWGVDRNTAVGMVQNNATGFSMDMKEMVANRALVHGRAKARFNLVEQMKELGVNLSDVNDDVGQALVRGGRTIEELGVVNVEGAALKGYVFDKDVAEILDRALNVTGADMNVFQKKMKQFMNYFKTTVTMTTGFHMRNFISNTVTQFLRHGSRAFNFDEYMMSVAGVATALGESSRKAFLGTLKIDETWMAKYLDRGVGNMTVRELFQEARNRGVISEATMGFDPTDVVQKVTGQKKGGIGKLYRAGAEASRGVGSYIENIPRFQSFLIDYIDNAADAAKITGTGDAFTTALRAADKPTLDWAGREAKKWFIDYSDLSAFEQKTMKNVIPFYSWIRNNLANQISGVALYPDLYSILPKIEEFATYEDPDYDASLIPEWMRNEGMFPIGKQEGGFRMFRPDLAHMDLNLLPFAWEEGKLFPTFVGEEMKDEIINATAPWVRRLADVMITSENPYQFFYKQELGPTADAPYLMRLFASRPGVVPLVDGFLKRLGFENGAELSEVDGRLKIDSRMAITLEEFLPVLRQLEFLFYLPQTVIPALEKVIEDFTGADDRYEGTEQTMQMLAYYLGIKTKDVDVEAERERLGRDIYYQAVEAYSEERKEQPGADMRSAENRRRVTESIRRLGG